MSKQLPWRINWSPSQGVGRWLWFELCSTMSPKESGLNIWSSVWWDRDGENFEKGNFKRGCEVTGVLPLEEWMSFLGESQPCHGFLFHPLLLPSCPKPCDTNRTPLSELAPCLLDRAKNASFPHKIPHLHIFCYKNRKKKDYYKKVADSGYFLSRVISVKRHCAG